MVLFIGAVSACSVADGSGEIDADALSPLPVSDELRLGSVDDPDEGFSNVGGVHVAPDGRMFVSERQDRQIRVFGPAGNALRSIGRQGQGPGEFMSLNQFGLVGDTLWALDQQSRRISLFSLDGDLLTTVPATGVDLAVPVRDLRVNAYPIALRSDGLFTSGFNFMVFSGGLPAQSFSVPRLLFDITGSPVDTAGTYTYQPPPQVPVAGRYVSVASPLTSQPIRLEAGIDSVVVERPTATGPGVATFTVLRLSEAGDTTFRRVFSYTPVPVTQAARDSLVRARISLPARSFPPEDTLNLRTAVESHMELPSFHPPVSTAHFGADGSIWLRREDDGTISWRWIVLTPEGEPRGFVSLPKSATLEWSDSERFWVVENDDSRIPWIVRYRFGP